MKQRMDSSSPAFIASTKALARRAAIVSSHDDQTKGQGFLLSAKADGSDEAELRASSPYKLAPYSWSPDGKVLAVYGSSANKILTLNERRELQPILQSEKNAWAPALSPDGRYIAYSSNRDGRDFQIYMRPYPAMDQIIPISRESGEEPIWSKNGNELFYRNRTKWMVVSISIEPEFSTGMPEVLFEGPYGQVGGLSYDVTKMVSDSSSSNPSTTIPNSGSCTS